MINRTFKDIPEGKISEADQHSFLMGLSWEKGLSWEELLKSQRVLIIAEAGAGKTYECHTQAIKLWSAGEPAFFVELAALATENLHELLSPEEEDRLNSWSSSQFGTATFFLDSIDELRLTTKSFRQALNRLRRCIGGQLHRSRIVITTRPIPLDEQLIREILPVPEGKNHGATEEEFAEIAMGELRDRRGKTEESYPTWRQVAIMPLSKQHVVEFAEGLGVSDSDKLLTELKHRNAEVFARRPQDLIELCADWRKYGQIRTHLNQVNSNVRVKLLPRQDGSELTQLAADKALEGASRIALAVMLTKQLTIRHSAASDHIDDEIALNPEIILSDWQPDEIKTLLERPLFSFASYGRVRFHHRSVAEYLAAQKLFTLSQNGMSYRSLARLLFAATRHYRIVRPSLRPIAAWLALQHTDVYEFLRDNEPSVLMNEGDPESLTITQRKQVLAAYADRYGSGSWRGIGIPAIQIQRFASKDLADQINLTWQKGIENPEVRDLMLRLIEAGKISTCADMAYELVLDRKVNHAERISAFYTLTAIGDARLNSFSQSLALGNNSALQSIAGSALGELFPKYMNADQLCQSLGWINLESRGLFDNGWRLARNIHKSEFDTLTLESLRDGLVGLISEGLKGIPSRPYIESDRPRLSYLLASTCVNGLKTTKDKSWLHASALALALHKRRNSGDEPIEQLLLTLKNLSAEDNALLFEATDDLYQSLTDVVNAKKRFIKIINFDSFVTLNTQRDLTWVKQVAGNSSKKTGVRAIHLYAAIQLHPDHKFQKEHTESLRPLIKDNAELIIILDEYLKEPSRTTDYIRYEKQQAKQEIKRKRQKLKATASWVLFRRTLLSNPESSLSSENQFNTIYNLCRITNNLTNRGDEDLGWSREFLEEHFGFDTTAKIRESYMKVWRDLKPTLPSKREPSKLNERLVAWNCGLAGIYAEAEDIDWATKLNNAEAQLAARYAPITLNSLPDWLEQLIKYHPLEVDQVLGQELSWELGLRQESTNYVSLLSSLKYSSKGIVKFFVPRCLNWLKSDGYMSIATSDSSAAAMNDKLRRAVWLILAQGGQDELLVLRTLSAKRVEQDVSQDNHLVWLSALYQLDPELAQENLERTMKEVKPETGSIAVTYLATLFGDRYDSSGLSIGQLSPQILIRLVRLAYHHIRKEDDISHKGTYSPGVRDNAQDARNIILTALYNAKGEEGMAAKLEIAADPLFAHLKDRIITVAHESWAHEIDSTHFDEVQVVTLNKTHEAPALTNESMFALLRDRLLALDDLLLSDASPRETWSLIEQEKLMRREITRVLIEKKNSIYTVDQEGVTASENRTDIRLRSTASNHEATIELKLGEKWSAKELLNTIQNQLVTKYMAAENSRAGALVITLSRKKRWRHPNGKQMIDSSKLLELLNTEAERVQEATGGGLLIYVHLVDLRGQNTETGNNLEEDLTRN